MNAQALRRASVAAVSLILAGGLWCQTYTVSVSSPSLSYSLTGNAEAAGTVTLKKSSTVKNASSFYVVFKLLSLSSTASSGGGSLSYGLYKSSSSTTALSLTGSPSSSDEVLSGSIAAGSASGSVSYVFRVSNSTFPASGTYTAKFTATVYKGNYSSSGTKTTRGSATITATVTVGKIASVAVVGGASDSFSFTSATSSPNYTLSLGDLTASTTGTAYILVLSNSTYSLSLTSANKGRLLNSSDSSAIGYTVTVNSGSTYSLTSATTIVSGASATYSAAARHALLFKLSGYGSNPSAGTYTDTIIVTVAAS